MREKVGRSQKIVVPDFFGVWGKIAESEGFHWELRSIFSGMAHSISWVF